MTIEKDGKTPSSEEIEGFRISTDLLYEGKNQEVFNKVLLHRFGGDKSVKSQLSVIFYKAMYESLGVLKPTVVSGESAAEAVDAITTAIANVLVAIDINIFPPEIQRSVMGAILIGLVNNVPEFLESSIKAIEDKDNIERNHVKN